MNNSKQSTLAWRMYSDDNRDVLLWSYGAGPTTSPYVWSGPSGSPWDIFPEFPTTDGNWDWTNTIAKEPFVAVLREGAGHLALPGGQVIRNHAR